jgi:hypothetical protein
MEARLLTEATIFGALRLALTLLGEIFVRCVRRTISTARAARSDFAVHVRDGHT